MTMISTSITIDEHDLAWYDRYNSKNRSGQVKEDMRLLRAMIWVAENELQGQFLPNEAQAICEALKGFKIDITHTEAFPQIISRAVDEYLTNGGAEKWDIRPGLVVMLYSLTPIQAYTVWHWSRLFWSTDLKAVNVDWVEKLFRCRREGGERQADHES